MHAFVDLNICQMPVSMGGTTGLFVGASLLSFIELIYYLLVRPYGTMYLARRNERAINEQQQRQQQQ